MIYYCDCIVFIRYFLSGEPYDGLDTFAVASGVVAGTLRLPLDNSIVPSYPLPNALLSMMTR